MLKLGDCYSIILELYKPCYILTDYAGGEILNKLGEDNN